MPNNSPQIIEKLAALNPPATAILDSAFEAITGFQDKAELVTTDQGRFISSPVDGWILHPLDGGG
jgi:hypothetical protein